jgi:hypothetical protein
MGQRHIAICDGCDAEELIVRAEGESPPSIKCVTISIKAAPDTTFDLCPRCEAKLMEYANPKQWKRLPKIVLERQD